MCSVVVSVENAMKQEFFDVSQKEVPLEICESDVPASINRAVGHMTAIMEMTAG